MVKAPPRGFFLISHDPISSNGFFAYMVGPDGTPYEGGIYRMSVDISGAYPVVPPVLRFVTNIYHINVDFDSGFISGAMYTDWTPDHTIKKALEMARLIIMGPILESPVNMGAITEFEMDPDTFTKKAKEFTSKFAVGHMSEWVNRIRERDDANDKAKKDKAAADAAAAAAAAAASQPSNRGPRVDVKGNPKEFMTKYMAAYNDAYEAKHEAKVKAALEEGITEPVPKSPFLKPVFVLPPQTQVGLRKLPDPTNSNGARRATNNLRRY